MHLLNPLANQMPRLMSTYNNLHASIHAKHTQVKVHHCVSQSATSFAWVTPMFELYCVAGPNANRNALAQSANKIVQWAQKEEERLFIIGGAVSTSQSRQFWAMLADCLIDILEYVYWAVTIVLIFGIDATHIFSFLILVGHIVETTS